MTNDKVDATAKSAFSRSPLASAGRLLHLRARRRRAAKHGLLLPRRHRDAHKLMVATQLEPAFAELGGGANHRLTEPRIVQDIQRLARLCCRPHGENIVAGGL